MDDKAASNIKVYCSYHPSSCYIQSCNELISSFCDLQIKSIDDLIRKMAVNYAHILNEINSQIICCMLDAREKYCLTTEDFCYEIRLDIDRTQKGVFINLLSEIEKLRSENLSCDELFKQKILESNETHHPILDEEQTDDTGSYTLHRIILLDDDLQPYRKTIFVK
ncbi:MAG: hypothetical protein IKZ29_09730 [Clostridiales bacterium]|nr:hypothetical protein [Clostridiales bacterium]